MQHVNGPGADSVIISTLLSYGRVFTRMCPCFSKQTAALTQLLRRPPDAVHCVLTGLSAAGVRARQEKVPFATCEDEDTLQEEVRSLLGAPLP